jgi:predicted nucleic acid-binding protein
VYLVDTSVWVEFLRKRGSPEIQSRLKPLIRNGETAITDWILLELMTGLRTTEDPNALLERFAPVHRLTFPDDGWKRAWTLAAALRRQGVTPSAADCYIATIAIGSKVRLIHADADFEAMAVRSDLDTLDWTVHL